MNARIAGSLALLVMTAALASDAQAQCVGCFVRSIGRDFERRNCWPEPFTYADRDIARAPFGIMVANGWERQNLLVDAYFDEKGSKLTDTGRVRVNWILFDAPPQHRVIYVHRAIRPEETSARLATVQTYVASVWQGSSQPPILASNVSGEGWSADRVDIVNKKFLQAIQAPQLPAATQGGSSSGSGSSTP
jgi:hypothetical protein